MPLSSLHFSQVFYRFTVIMLHTKLQKMLASMFLVSLRKTFKSFSAALFIYLFFLVDQIMELPFCPGHCACLNEKIW